MCPEHEVTAMLSPPRDPQALARNITRLLDDDGLRQRLSANCYRVIASENRWVLEAWRW
jgi:glycosyltransferase involved in cell wall biosynthesis